MNDVKPDNGYSPRTYQDLQEGSKPRKNSSNPKIVLVLRHM